MGVLLKPRNRGFKPPCKRDAEKAGPTLGGSLFLLWQRPAKKKPRIDTGLGRSYRVPSGLLGGSAEVGAHKRDLDVRVPRSKRPTKQPTNLPRHKNKQTNKQASEREASTQASERASKQANKQASEQASKPNMKTSKRAIKQASKRASKQANQQASKHTSKRATK